MMHRNLDRRVEALVRVDGESHRARLRWILELGLADTGAWLLAADGTWARQPLDGHPEISVQESLMLAAHRAATDR